MESKWRVSRRDIISRCRKRRGTVEGTSKNLDIDDCHRIGNGIMKPELEGIGEAEGQWE